MYLIDRKTLKNLIGKVETLLLLNKKQNTVNSCFLSIGFFYIYIYIHTHTHTMTRTFMDLAQKLKLVIRMMELIH
jgi:hypothetical protein